MLQFRDSLVRYLLIGVPYENLKPGPRERSTSQTKRAMLVDGALATMRRGGQNSQEKRPTQQQRK